MKWAEFITLLDALHLYVSVEASNWLQSVYMQVSETSLVCKPISNQFKIIHVDRLLVCSFL